MASQSRLSTCWSRRETQPEPEGPKQISKTAQRLAADHGSRNGSQISAPPVGGGLYDNGGGGVQKWVATSDGVHGTERVPHDLESRGPLFSVGQSGQFALEFELTKSSSQVSASGAGASLQYSTSALDLSQGLGVLVFIDNIADFSRESWRCVTAGLRVDATSILVAYGVAALIGESGLTGEWSALGQSA